MSNAVKALNYAVAHGAKVVNNSYGGGGSDPAMAAAIDNARAHGVIFVAAAGNDGTNNDTSPVYPANYSANNVVTVAATDRNDRLASFSNYGRTTVDLAAPGVSILSTLPGNRYGVYSGTSMATPHVVGALALVWDAHPTWTYRQVIDAVLNTTHPLASLRGKVATGGRLDVLKAITYRGAPANAGPNVTAVTFPGTGATISSARVTFSETLDPATFTAADLTFTGPNNQAIRVTGVTAIAGSSHQQFDVAFATQTVAGSYRLKIGADVRNTAGHQLDQNGNGVAGEATDTFTATTTVATIRTFASTNVGQIIADFGRVVSSINLTQGITIRDLNVRLAISHSYVGDLKVTLIGPDGTRVVLTNRRGGSGNDFGNTTFDDEAGQSIGQGTAPFAGSFRPESSLSTFNGKNARGLWQLVVEDKALFDTGRLTSWSLTFDDTGVRSRGIAESSVTTASALKEPAFDATGLFARGDGPAHHSAVEAPTGPRDESRLSELSARPAIAAAPAAWVGQQPAMAWHAENWFWEE